MRQHIVNLGDSRDRGQHASLLLQRYPLVYKATGDKDKSEEKQRILQAAIKAAADGEVRELYRLVFERWKESLPKMTTGLDLETDGRLIVGLGAENVLDTGIRLHHTYGLPVLPGSALKGLAAHYCNQVWGETNDSFKYGGDYHHLLFGTTDESGCIIFHDALFIPESEKEPLKLDVMTPHHPKWLDGGIPPTDFDSPTPVPFLSVVGQFYVAVSWCGPDHEEAMKWTELTLSLLKKALEEWGIGGKTTSGYGRLIDPPPPPPPPPYKGKPGDIVDAVLLEEKTKKGGWKAQIKGHSQIGPINNMDAVPKDLNPGDTVSLTIASLSNERQTAFKWHLSSGE